VTVERATARRNAVPGTALRRATGVMLEAPFTARSPTLWTPVVENSSAEAGNVAVRTAASNGERKERPPGPAAKPWKDWWTASRKVWVPAETKDTVDLPAENRPPRPVQSPANDRRASAPAKTPELSVTPPRTRAAACGARAAVLVPETSRCGTSSKGPGDQDCRAAPVKATVEPAAAPNAAVPPVVTKLPLRSRRAGSCRRTVPVETVKPPSRFRERKRNVAAGSSGARVRCPNGPVDKDRPRSDPEPS
jgi:hypothetical protein